MRVIFTPGARTQLKSIYDHIAKDNEIAAHAVIARIEHLANLLGEYPDMGFELPRRRLRRFPAHPYPYPIYFEVADDAVRIVRVRHAAHKRAAFHDLARPFVFWTRSNENSVMAGNSRP
jgi:plasmid stabilization system protein ParE